MRPVTGATGNREPQPHELQVLPVHMKAALGCCMCGTEEGRSGDSNPTRGQENLKLLPTYTYLCFLTQLPPTHPSLLPPHALHLPETLYLFPLGDLGQET